MKRIAVIIACILLAISLCSCGEKDEPLKATLVPVSSAPAAMPEGWPADNEYLAVLPTLPSTLELTDVIPGENTCSVMLVNCDYAMAEKYAQTLKNSGFCNNVREAGYKEVNMYMFSGENAEGFSVDMIFSYMSLAITVKK